MTQHYAVVIGCGLIGGSFVKALRNIHADAHITVIDTDAQACALMQEEGLVNQVSDRLEASLFQSATTILIATPPHCWQDIATTLATYDMPALTLLMDVGSVKQYALECLASFPTYVAAHPIAGMEFSGTAYSTVDLFAGKRVIFTPTADTNADALAQATRLWEEMEAVPVTLDADIHDRIYAYVSHLPQLLAYAIAGATLEHVHGNQPYIQFLRLAGSSPALWRGIMEHSPHVSDAAESYLQLITHVLAELRTGTEQHETPLNMQRGAELTPRILASCLIGVITIEEQRGNVKLARYAGSGFADMAAPAMTDPEDELSLISQHTDVVITLLEMIEAQFRAMVILLKRGQWQDLQDIMQSAQNAYIHQLN